MNESLSKRQLESLLYATNVMNSSLDFETIIESLLQVCVSQVQAIDGGVLFLFDEERQQLIAKKTTVLDKTIIDKVALKPGESMTGQCFIRKEIVLFQGRESVNSLTDTLSPENKRYLHLSVPTMPYSTICAPLLIKGQCLGVITLDAFKPVEISDEDLKLVKAISQQAAVTLENARLYQTQERAMNDVKRVNYALQRSSTIHRELTELVLNGQSLNEITSYIGNRLQVDYAVLNEESDFSVSASSPQLKELIETHYPSTSNFPLQTEVLELKDRHLHFVAFRLGSRQEPIGWLLCSKTEPFDAIDTNTLEHASSILAMELIKTRAIEDAQLQMRGEFAEQLFSGVLKEDLPLLAKRLHLPVDGDFVVAIARFDAPIEKIAMYPRVVQQATKHFQQFAHFASLDSRELKVIVHLPPNREVYEVTAIWKGWIAELEALTHCKVSVGIGKKHSHLRRAYSSSQEAYQTLRHLEKMHSTQVVLSFDELGLHRLLLQSPKEDIQNYIQETMGTLLHYDQEKNGDLILTLRTYFSNQQQMKATAEELHIHANTLIYRLRRIEEITGRTLTNLDDLLSLHTALHFLQDEI